MRHGVEKKGTKDGRRECRMIEEVKETLLIV